MIGSSSSSSEFGVAFVVVDCTGDCLVGSSNDSLKELDNLFISLRRGFEQIGPAPAEQSLKSQSFDASGKVFKLSMFCL